MKVLDKIIRSIRTKILPSPFLRDKSFKGDADFRHSICCVFCILFFVFYFRPFLVTISIIKIETSVDGVHGIQTRGCRMVGADETMELWRPQFLLPLTAKDVCLRLLEVKFAITVNRVGTATRQFNPIL